MTKNVPAGAIVGGNPARVIRWRVPPAEGPARSGSVGDLGDRLTAFAARAREQAEEILARSWNADLQGGLFVDRPGQAVTVRAQCDAIEIADLLLSRPPAQLPAAEQRDRLRRLQDPKTGLVPSFDTEGLPLPAPTDLFDGEAAYHVSASAMPSICWAASSPSRCIWWRKPAPPNWSRTSRDGRGRAGLELGGLDRHGRDGDAVERTAGGGRRPWRLRRRVRLADDAASPRTGLWGEPEKNDGLMQVVNGFYRASAS